MSETYSLQTAFSKIKEILGFDITPTAPVNPAPVPEPIQVQLTEVELKNGTKLTVDKLEAGGLATIDNLPAPVGDYEAIDGSIIKVGEGGVITEIVAAAPVEVPDAQMNQAPVVVQNPAPAPQYVTPHVVQQMEAQFKSEKDELKLSFETQIANQNLLIGKQKEAIEELFKVVQKMAEIPNGDPIEPPKLSFAGELVQGRKEKMEKLADNMKNFREKLKV